MIEQIKTFKDNRLAIEVIDRFTEADEKIGQKLFNEKIDQGLEPINILIKLDEMKISKSSMRAIVEDVIWAFRNYKKMGHLALVANSKFLKALVPVDNFFYKKESKGRLEKYFDISQIDDAFKFIAV